MRVLKLLAVTVSVAFAALLLTFPPLPSHSQGFVDRIVRPCSSGAVTQANVIANPNSSGNINVTPCTGGSLTVNGVPVIAGGLPDPGSNGFVVRTAASTVVARTLGGSNGISVSNGSGVAGNPDVAGVNAAADGATKGVSAFNANDFNAAAGVIALDYANGQSASALLKGYLTAADWSTFDAKQPAGNYITALTGDGTATGPGSVALTLANVVAAGSCTACNLTYDAKGRITAAANGSTGITNSAGIGVVPVTADGSGNLSASNVDNTSDASKPVSTAQQAALDLKANIASPIFTGTVTIPTPFTLGAVSVLPTGTELNFVDGVTSAIQTQLDSKQATITVLPVANGGTNASSASITAFNNITGYAAGGATGTTSTNLVFSTSPVIATPQIVTSINDSNGNEIVRISPTGSAINEITIANAAVGSDPVFSATGGDAVIGFVFTPKGAGNFTLLTGDINFSGSGALAWNSALTGMRLGGNSTLSTNTSPGAGTSTQLAHNAYFDSVGPKYISTDEATYLEQINGLFNFYSAASGTAGNAITFTNSFSVLITGVSATAYSTKTNCADSAGAAACGSAAAGSVVIDAGATSVVVSTTAVTANSQITPVFDSSLGARLGVTCNATIALPAITARTAGTSFTITVAVAPITNPACFGYTITN